jgi:tetratricopeptide (TPR) repeat protein
MSVRSNKNTATAQLSTLASESRPAGMNDRWLVPGVCIFLAAIVWLVFGQTLHHEFVYYDDHVYVYENPVVTQGLSLKGVEWAFSHIVACNWHPLTWLSHMLDCQLYGLNAGGPHLTNVVLHTASVILLFLVLRRMTGFLWRSAFVAAVFAIHPLHVESVAWVAERKDVLSALFFMLTIGAYVRYVEKSKVQGPKSKVFYGLVLLFFALGLMCKPMLVTLPFVLLLLDYWPLGRLTRFRIPVPQPSSLNHLLLEKLPLFGLALASCAVTIFAQAKAIMPIEYMSLSLRAGNASISCVAYLGQMFWPAGLAVLYPVTVGDIGVFEVVLSLVLLAGISAGAFFLRRRRPYFLTGWLWYLIMLAPVIGIVQVGIQARADRYTYLSQIGLYLLLTWGVADLCASWRHRRLVLGGGATVILAALIICARVQASYWQNSESLWTRTLACTSDNYTAHNYLGYYLFQKGRVDEAIVHFQKAVQIKPDYAEACYNLGNALLQNGRVDEAIVYYQKVLQIKTNSLEVLNNLAWLLTTSPDAHIRDGAQAVRYAERACELTHYGLTTVVGTLAAAYAEAGRFDDAIATAQKACALASKSGEQDLLEKNQKLLALYRAHQSYHEAAETLVPAAP